MSMETAALGAGRGRLIRQFLTESVVLSSVGGILGVGIGYAMMIVLKRAFIDAPLNPAMVTFLVAAEAVVGLDWRVLTFTVALSLVCGVGVGLVPAMGAIRTNVSGFGQRASASVAHRHRACATP
jgi:ABC-type antimicrobial peptide transport system permease subunit